MLIELSREQREIVQQFRALAQANFRARAPRHDLECSFVTENFNDLARAGLLALPVPREYGGLGGGIGGDHLLQNAVRFEIAQACGSTALCFGHHCDVVSLIKLVGTPEQKKRLFNEIVARGIFFASLAAEPPRPRADTPDRPTTRFSLQGTFAFGTTARRVEGGYCVNGTKAYVSSAGFAPYNMSWCVVEDTEEKPEGADFLIAVIPTDAPGVTVEQRWDSMGMRGTATDLIHFRDCFVPDADILGGEPNAFHHADIRAALWAPTWHAGQACTYLGQAADALEFTREYVKGKPARKPGDIPPAENPFSLHSVGEMDTLLHAAWQLIAAASRAFQRAEAEGTGEAVAAAAMAAYRAKIMAQQASHRIVHLAFQVSGTSATFLKYPLHRILRDVTTFTLHDNINARYLALGELLLDAREFSQRSGGWF